MATARSSEEYDSQVMFGLVGTESALDQELRDLELDRMRVISKTVGERGHNHTVASRLFELSSVRIQPHDWIGCSEIQIFGHIILSDPHSGREFPVFKRGSEDPETVVTSDNTSAILQKSRLDLPHWLPETFWLKVDLHDKIRKTQIIKSKTLLDFRGDFPYDREQEHEFGKARYGIVTMRYTVFRCAVLGFVSFTVLRNEEGSESSDSGPDPSDVASVRGTISGSSKLSSKKEISRLIFDEKNAELAVIDDPKELLELAVPAYSPLKIQADLEVEGEPLVTSVAMEFEPRRMSTVWKYIVGCNWRIQVCVSWSSAYGYDEYISSVKNGYFELLPLLPSFIPPIDLESKLECGDSSPKKPLEKRPKLLSIPMFEYPNHVRKLVEVFSIFVGSFASAGNNALRVYGTIESYDAENDYLIFKRDESNPAMLSHRNTVALKEQHHCYEADGSHFGMVLDLKDAEGHEISKGYLAWANGSALWWDYRPICSVVRGEHGFAAVHHTILKHAVTARLKVIWSSNSSCQVFGSICASYSTYKYSTEYEKNYYRSMLFDKGSDELVEFYGDCQVEVPLSKYVVAVPVHASLIVETEWHLLVKGKLADSIRHKATFNPKKSEVTGVSKLDGGTFCLSVTLEWG